METGRDFEVKGNAPAVIQTLRKVLFDYAFAQAEEFIDCGQTPREACSIVSNILIRTAWIVAGTGAEADNRVPNPDLFRASVEDVLSSVTFGAADDGETMGELA